MASELREDGFALITGDDYFAGGDSRCTENYALFSGMAYALGGLFCIYFGFFMAVRHSGVVA